MEADFVAQNYVELNTLPLQVSGFDTKDILAGIITSFRHLELIALQKILLVQKDSAPWQVERFY